MTDYSDTPRVESVDALRGLAVLMVFAATYGARVVYGLPRSGVVDALRIQLRPSVWNGITVADLCYPAFLVVAGISLVLSSNGRRTSGASRWSSPGHPEVWSGRSSPVNFVKWSLARGVLLFGIGVIVQTLAMGTWPRIVWCGAFEQLAVCILLGSVGVVLLPTVGWSLLGAVGLLAISGGLLEWWSSLESHASRLDFQHNLAVVVDGRFVPGVKWFGEWDPHGLFTTMPSLAVLILGCAMGHVIVRTREEPMKGIARLIAIGVGAVNLGFVTNRFQPWNSHLMTPAFSLTAVGLVSLVLAVLMACGRSTTLARWGCPLRVLGRNSLLVIIMLLTVPLSGVSHAVVSGEVAAFLGGTAPLFRGLIELAVVYGPAHLLYRRGVFVTLSSCIDRVFSFQ